jgi:hypothetical protein
MAHDEHPRFTLDELEHQALDTLDATAADDPDGDDPELVAARATATSVFRRLIAVAAELLLAAAQQLATTEDRGPLDPEALAQLRDRLREQPDLAPALPSAVEAVGVSLGLEREGMAWLALVQVGEEAGAKADEATRRCAAALAERLAVAHPRAASRVAPHASGSQDPRPGEPSSALRVFRSAVVTAAGPEVRARFLAADHPEQIELARALVAQIADPEQLVAQFDAGRAALAAADPPAKAPGLGASGVGAAEAITDGPKRKFTRVHLILALIILGLTVWHYGFR